MDSLPTIESASVSPTDDIKKEEDDSNEPKTISTILPPRNENAKSVSEVYNLNNIIREEEELTILANEEMMMNGVKNDYFKNLIGKKTDSTVRVMGIYADLLLQLVKLSLQDLRRIDPLPLVETNIKKLLFDRFTVIKQGDISNRSSRYVITDQEKDRIFVYIFLLIIMLNDYKTIELEKMQTLCKISFNNIRRMFEVIGCYIETFRVANGMTVKVARLKLPLNTIKEPKRKSFGRR